MDFASEKGTSAQKVVLLAEDDDLVRSLVQQALTRKGYRVIAHPDGREALSCFQEDGDDVDLIVTDIVMPRLNGRDLARKCRELRPKIGILYISGNLEGQFDLTEDLTGNAAFLAKPFRPAELLGNVETLINADSAED